MSKHALMNKEPAEWLANAFKKVDWPVPAYLAMGFLGPLAKKIQDAPPGAKSEIMRQALATAYSPHYLLSRLFRTSRFDIIQAKSVSSF
jgi:hypothetical protein